MNAEQFKYWLEGFIEGADALKPSEVQTIKEKLKTVYSSNVWITPSQWTTTPYSITVNNPTSYV